MKKTKILILVFLSFLFLSINSSPLIAQETETTESDPNSNANQNNNEGNNSNNSEHDQNEVKDVSENEVSGEVVRIDERVLFVETDNGIMEIDVPENIQIVKNGLDANFPDIEVGDEVSVSFNENGEVLGIDAVSVGSDDLAKYLIPGLIILAIIAVLLYFLMKNRNKGEVKTTTSTNV